MFDRLKAAEASRIASLPRQPIKIQLADGRLMDGESWKTTPFDVAKLLGTFVLDDLIVAKVNGELYDLSRPLEADCCLELLTFEHPDGTTTFSLSIGIDHCRN